MPKKVKKVKAVTIVKLNKSQKQKRPKSKVSNEISALARDSRVHKSLQRFFVSSIEYPDIIGPIRVPRPGGSERTGLAQDRLIYATSSTTLYTLIVMRGTYSGGCIDTVTTTGSSGTFSGPPTPFNPAVQFPSPTQIDDINITAGCITVGYTGSPLNITGEIVFGIMPYQPSGYSLATFDSLTYYPGSIRMPLNRLIYNGGIRVPLVKYSPDSYAFVSTSSVPGDIGYPFVALSPTVTALAVTLNIYRNYEYRSTIATGLQIPYAVRSDSSSGDVSAYADASNKVGSAANPSTSTEGEHGGLLAAIAPLLGSIPEPLMEMGRDLVKGAVGNVKNEALRYWVANNNFGINIDGKMSPSIENKLQNNFQKIVPRLSDRIDL